MRLRIGDMELEGTPEELALYQELTEENYTIVEMDADTFGNLFNKE